MKHCLIITVIVLGCLLLAACTLNRPFVIAPDGAATSDGPGRKTALTAAAEANDVTLIRRLLDEGAEVDDTLPDGRTAARLAFENDAFNAFKILMERGAGLRFLDHFKKENASVEQRRLMELSTEFTVYHAMIKSAPEISLEAFDAYFSRFPNGYYAADVQDLLAARIENDMQIIRSVATSAELEQLYAAYAKIGQRAYAVTADRLNIRSDWNLQANIIGHYEKGDRIHALENKMGWLRTDLGWISSVFTQKRSFENPLIQALLNSIQRRIHAMAPPAPVQPKDNEANSADHDVSAPHQVIAPRVDIRPEAPPPEKPDDIKPRLLDEKHPVVGEFETVMADPSLKRLETFIQTYKNIPQYADLVSQAREKYKTILIDE